MLLYAYFTPKVDFKRKFNTTNRFFTNDIDSADDSKIRIGPSIRIESRIGRTIRNRIESRSFAGPYSLVYDSTLYCDAFRKQCGPRSRNDRRPSQWEMRRRRQS